MNMTESLASSGPVTITPGTGHFYISPIGFWARAQDLLDASVLLQREAGRFSFIAAHLSCSSIEVALKAYLLARGCSADHVRKLGHDLQACVIESFVHGIDNVVALTKAERDLLLRVNDYYADRRFMYFDIDSAIVRPKDPELELLPNVARKLLDGVERICLDATGG